MLRKYHKLKKRAYFVTTQLISRIWYRYLELNTWVKISIFWTLITIMSLFFPWIQSLDWITPLNSGNFSENAFSIYAWYVWYFLFLLLLLILFTLLSKKRKERLKYFSLLDIPESILVFFTANILTIICIQYFFLVWSFQSFSQNIVYWTGLILATTWTIVLYAWYVSMKKNRKKSNSAIMWYDDSENIFEKKYQDPDNMKLPF